ncbi:MAG: MarR family transcriptional regulator [Fidelibacterota bacterium]|nr:MAG: MarR family transcriptional regulator [Candidatus Neomarinimicrobiota bacterium]
MHIAEVLRDLTCQLQALLRSVAHTHQLSLTQAEILLSLPLDGLPVSTLAQRLGLDTSTVSRIIKNMEVDGWVHRAPATNDRRVTQVTLTAGGTVIYQQLNASFNTEVNRLLANVPAEQQEILSQHLEDLTWKMMQHRG